MSKLNHCISTCYKQIHLFTLLIQLYLADFQLIIAVFSLLFGFFRRKKFRKLKKFSTNVYFIKKKQLLLQTCLFMACSIETKNENDIFINLL